MLCLAPIFSIGGQQLPRQTQLSFFFLFFLFSREKKEQNKNKTKWLLFSFFDKFIKNDFFSLEEGFCFSEHLTLQSHNKTTNF